MFVEDIFKYVQFSKVQITRDGKLKELTNAFEIWQEIEKGNEWVGNVGADEKIDIDKYKGTTEWKQFDDLVKSFNKSLKDLVDTINNISPTYFKQLGYDFEFNLNLKNEASYKEDLRSYEYIPFNLALDVPEYEKEKNALHKPHSFLNEAKLSAMAISIRLAILSEKRLENCLKFIVLDDLLISLDMRNREKVLELLLSADFIDNYQLIILTHDRMFFQMAKHKIAIYEQTNWKYIEMYEVKDDVDNSKPQIKQSQTYYERAVEFNKKNNLPEAANNLRKAGEEFCKRILSKKQTITEDYSDYDLNGMIELCLNFAIANDLQQTYFNQLDKFRKFLLNSSSHDDYDTPMFKSELSDCIKIFETYFNKVKLKHILPEDTILSFELVDGKKGETYKYEITLKENLRIYKEPSKDIYLIRVKVSYELFKDGIFLVKENKQISLKDIYDKSYSTSDNKKNANFLKEILIGQTGKTLETVVKF
jgi:hypothetical protein